MIKPYVCSLLQNIGDNQVLAKMVFGFYIPQFVLLFTLYVTINNNKISIKHQPN